MALLLGIIGGTVVGAFLGMVDNTDSGGIPAGDTLYFGDTAVLVLWWAHCSLVGSLLIMTIFCIINIHSVHWRLLPFWMRSWNTYRQCN